MVTKRSLLGFCGILMGFAGLSYAWLAANPGARQPSSVELEHEQELVCDSSSQPTAPIPLDHQSELSSFIAQEAREIVVQLDENRTAYVEVDEKIVRRSDAIAKHLIKSQARSVLSAEGACEVYGNSGTYRPVLDVRLTPNTGDVADKIISHPISRLITSITGASLYTLPFSVILTGAKGDLKQEILGEDLVVMQGKALLPHVPVLRLLIRYDAPHERIFSQKILQLRAKGQDLTVLEKAGNFVLTGVGDTTGFIEAVSSVLPTNGVANLAMMSNRVPVLREMVDVVSFPGRVFIVGGDRLARGVKKVWKKVF